MCSRYTLRVKKMVRTLVAVMVLMLMYGTFSYQSVQINAAAGELAECAVPDADWIFCEDFEEQRNVTDTYYKYNDFDKKLFREEGMGLSDSYGLKSTFLKQGHPNGGGYRFAFGKIPSSVTSTTLGDSEETVREFYFRTYFKNEEDWQGSANGRLFYFQALNSANEAVSRVSLQHGSGTIAVIVQSIQEKDGKIVPYGSESTPSGGKFASTKTNILGKNGHGNWHEVQIHVKANDVGEQNGEVRVWVDGELEIHLTKLNLLNNYTEYGFNSVFFENSISDINPKQQYRYYDNMVLSRSYIPSIEIPEELKSNIVFEDDFNSYTDSPKNHKGWAEVHSHIVIDPNSGKDGTNAAKIPFTKPDWYMMQIDIARYDMKQAFVNFDFKIDAPVDDNRLTKGGSKFLKLFGKKGVSTETGVANTTFGLDYFTNHLIEIFYGPGRQVNNDVQVTVKYNGEHHDPLVNINYATDTFVPQTDVWYNYKAFMKYNSDGNRDGEYIVWIDDKLVVHATNVVYRHPLNRDEFEHISLGDITYTNAAHPWSTWYDNVQVMRDIPEPFKSQLPIYAEEYKNRHENPPIEEPSGFSCDNRDASWIYCEDFETEKDPKDLYFKYNDFATKLSRVEGIGVAESKALKTTFANQAYAYGGGYRFAFGKTPASVTDTVLGNKEEPVRELFFRTFVKNEESWQGAENGRLFYFPVLNSNNQAVARVALEYASGVPYTFIQTAQFDEQGKPKTFRAESTLSHGLYNVAKTNVLGKNAGTDWHELQVQIKANDVGLSNGELRVWINGQLEIERTNINLLGDYTEYGFNAVYMENGISTPNSKQQYRYFDNMVLSTTYIDSAVPVEQ